MSTSAFGVEHTISKGGINPVSATHGVGKPLGPLAGRLHAERAARGGTLLAKPQFRMKASDLQRINPNTRKK